MISVCMATYNGARYIKQQIDSILCQLNSNDELIISDDGSSDGTVEYIKSLKDERIKLYYHKKKKGLCNFSYTTSNFYNALRHASGDYIFLSDQDDVWLPNKVKTMIEAFDELTMLVIANYKVIDSQGSLLTTVSLHNSNSRLNALYNAFIRCSYIGSNMCFKKDLLNNIGGLPTNVPHDLWFGFWAAFSRQFKQIDDITFMYRRHSNNVSVFKNIDKKKHRLIFDFNLYFDIIKKISRRIILTYYIFMSIFNLGNIKKNV